MNNQLSQIKWGRVTVTALAVYILSFLTIFIIITGYATYLGFQARGAPDPTLIASFANQYSPWIGPISLILFTLVGAMLMARRVENAAPLHGIILGLLTSLINLVFDGLSLNALAITILTIAAGWLGSRLTAKK